MRNRFQYRVAVVVAAVAVGASISSCSSETSEGPEIIATTDVWADVAAAVTGGEVEAIITGDAVDPHHYEATAKDLARIKSAGTVVANGGGYDAALYTAAEQDRVIFAIPPIDAKETHDHSHAHEEPGSPDDIEHAWFSPAKIREVADAVAEKTGGDAGDVERRVSDIEAKLQSLPDLRIGMTEPIAAGLVWGTELHDATPEEYAKASLNHQEPSAAAVAAFLDQIERGELDVLFVNPQSTNSATQRLADAATANNVPVVEIRETPPSGQDFLDYLEHVVDQIADTAKH